MLSSKGEKVRGESRAQGRLFRGQKKNFWARGKIYHWGGGHQKKKNTKTTTPNRNKHAQDPKKPHPTPENPKGTTTNRPNPKTHKKKRAGHLLGRSDGGTTAFSEYLRKRDYPEKFPRGIPHPTSEGESGRKTITQIAKISKTKEVCGGELRPGGTGSH